MSDTEKHACPNCGCEELDHRGLWTCRCPAPQSDTADLQKRLIGVVDGSEGTPERVLRMEAADALSRLQAELVEAKGAVDRVQTLHEGIMEDAEKRYDALYGEYTQQAKDFNTISDQMLAQAALIEQLKVDAERWQWALDHPYAETGSFRFYEGYREKIIEDIDRKRAISAAARSAKEPT